MFSLYEILVKIYTSIRRRFKVINGKNAQTIEDVKSALRKLYTEYKLRGKISYQRNVATEKCARIDITC